MGTGYVNVRAIPDALLFPLYNKIRLPYSAPMKDIIDFDDAWRSVVKSVPALPALEWDLRLLTIAKLRQDITGWASLTPQDREKLLTSSLPRFLWLATARDDTSRRIDIVFDATDIDSGDYIRIIHIHDPLISAAIDTIRKAPSNLLSDTINSIFDKVNTQGM